ncbi:MFS transporter [Embleya hyalina]|uniref:Membrane transport protein n=1 Tax=Embleya hyalina TaxID=516124 RepID=A0A401YMV5_9ACTN|nr:MFS transporter [Embleya hyalina]GCD95946.1 membrane transport protein [Embleya hyalina]
MATRTEAEPPAGKVGNEIEVDTGRLDGAGPGRVFAVVAVVIMFAEVVPLQYAMIAPAVQQVGHTWPEVGDNLTWMVIILGLVGGATTPIVGNLADLYGKRRVMLAGSVSFLAGSLLCATTHDWTLFLIGRALQASCFALTAIAVGLLRDLVPRRYVPVAIGALATGFGLSGVLSPLVGGALTQSHSWRSLFWFLVVYMLVLIPLMVWVVPESRVRARQELDWVGAVLVGVGAALVLVYLSQGQSWGWSRPSAWGYLLAGLVVLVVFWVWETWTPAPMMDPRLLRAPKVSIVLAIGFLANVVIGGAGLAVPYMAQTDAGEITDRILAGAAAQAHAPVEMMRQVIGFEGGMGYALGLSLLGYAVHITIGMSATGMVAGPVGGWWGQRSGLRAPLVAAMAVLTGSMVLLAGFHGTWFAVMLVMSLYGVGMGMYYAAANNLIVEAVPKESSGVGAGMLAVAQSFGAALGTAVVTAVLSAHAFRMTSPSPTGQGTVTTDIPQVYTDSGWTTALWVLAAAALVGTVLAVVMRTGRTPATGGAALEVH